MGSYSTLIFIICEYLTITRQTYLDQEKNDKDILKIEKQDFMY